METTLDNSINKDLILRERLAIQRTIMANQTTLLSFIRTSLYFLVAGLSIKSLLHVENNRFFEIPFFIISAILFITGIVNYFRQKKLIASSEKHVGNFKTEYIR
jgi:putative membrane protein